MRTSIAETKPVFSPFTVSITIENELEAKLLADLILALGSPQSVRDLFCDYDTDINAQTSFCDALFPSDVYTKIERAATKNDKILSRF